jgi:hypothetical protein
MGASVALMSFIELETCRNNGKMYLFTVCDLFEMTCLLVWLLQHNLVDSSKTLAVLSSHDAIVNRGVVALSWRSAFVLIIDVDTDLSLVLSLMMDCKSLKPFSTVARWVLPYQSGPGIIVLFRLQLSLIVIAGDNSTERIMSQLQLIGAWVLGVVCMSLLSLLGRASFGLAKSGAKDQVH